MRLHLGGPYLCPEGEPQDTGVGPRPFALKLNHKVVLRQLEVVPK